MRLAGRFCDLLDVDEQPLLAARPVATVELELVLLRASLQVHERAARVTVQLADHRRDRCIDFLDACEQGIARGNFREHRRGGVGLAAHPLLHDRVAGVLEKAIRILDRYAEKRIGYGLRGQRRRDLDAGEGSGVQRLQRQRREQRGTREPPHPDPLPRTAGERELDPSRTCNSLSPAKLGRGLG